jgi:hypothetical protein
MASDTEFHVPDVKVTESLLERVQFSVSSRNAEAKICQTVAHVFGSPNVVSPRAIDWNYITTGLLAMLRNKEVVKKKYVWSLNLCIYNIQHGVLVWKGTIPMDCNYTDVSDNFHVLSLGEENGIMGIVFQDEDVAKSFYSTITSWIAEGLKDDKGKPPPEASKVKFRKEMISKPCNFQHIQGSQAIDECIEIERVKGHILASLASFKLKDTTDAAGLSKSRSSSKSKKKDQSKPKIPFKEIEAPATFIERTGLLDSTDGDSDTLTNGTSPTPPPTGYRFQPTPPLSRETSFPPQPPPLNSYNTTGGSSSDNSQSSSSHLGRLSPLNLEDELAQSFAFTSLTTGLPTTTTS